MDKIYVDARMRFSRTHLFWVGKKESIDNLSEKVPLYDSLEKAYYFIGEGILWGISFSKDQALLRGAEFSQEDDCYYLPKEVFLSLDRLGTFLVLTKEEEKKILGDVGLDYVEINTTID